MIAYADFSGDETLCLLIAFIMAWVGLAGLYFPIFSIPLLGRSFFYRVILALAPIIGLSFVWNMLYRWADVQVVGHADYIFLFLVVGAAFFAITFEWLIILGINIRTDVVDRNNPAALWVSVGAILGVSIIYAMANVGGGPTIWTTIVPGGQSAFVLFRLMLLIEFSGLRVSESVTIGRDVASGIRVSGALIGCGIVLGRAAGGVWISFEQSLLDLARLGWPAVGIALAAGFVHRKLGPCKKSSKPAILAHGILPAIGLVSAGICAVCFMPHAWHLSKW